MKSSRETLLVALFFLLRKSSFSLKSHGYVEVMQIKGIRQTEITAELMS